LGIKKLTYIEKGERGIYMELVQPRIGRSICRRKRDGRKAISLEIEGLIASFVGPGITTPQHLDQPAPKDERYPYLFILTCLMDNTSN
jgi:hypothetical protein